MARKFFLDNRKGAISVTIIGISCHCRDYQLSFYLQRKLELDLARQEDYNGHPFFYCLDDNDFNIYYLIGNRQEDSVLVPEFRQLDFLLFIEGPFNKQQKDHYIRTIKAIPNVLLATEILPNSIKNPEVIVHDLEIHARRNNPSGQTYTNINS
jgi:hypothetical protein